MPFFTRRYSPRSLALLLTFGILLTTLSNLTASAQETPNPPSADSTFSSSIFSSSIFGIVWEPPPDPQVAWQAMQQMRARGLTAVRTPILTDTLILAYADRLGLALYQDVPAAWLTATALQDTLTALIPVLTSALTLARTHPSARHFGLAQFADTSDPATCDALRVLADHTKQQGPPGTQTYYLTVYEAADLCHGSVDLVLLDARNSSDPVAALTRWPHDTPVGLGAVGWRIDALNAEGTAIRGSAEWQARQLEHALPDLVQAGAPFFLHRWRDAVSGAYAADDPRSERYGLLAADGTPRPAAHVVGGLLTGHITAFAFPTGQAPRAPIPWSILMGWAVVLTVAVLYASMPRLRFTIPRYFFAHGFYRESVREGREVLPNATLVLLVCIGVAVGILTQMAADAMRNDPAVLYLLRHVPDVVRDLMVPLLDEPGHMLWVAGIPVVVSLMLWSLLPPLIASGPFHVAQSIMLAVWPFWLLLPLMVVGMVTNAMTPPPPMLLRGVLLGWLIVTCVAYVRTMLDIRRVVPMSANSFLLLVITHPLIITLLGLGMLILAYPDQSRFVLHLLTRT